MSDFRFNAFDNLKTPESSIEKAVNIPKTNKKPIPMFLRPTVIGSAAVVCLVTAVVLTLRLTFGFGKPPVNSGQAVAPHSLAVSEDTTVPQEDHTAADTSEAYTAAAPTVPGETEPSCYYPSNETLPREEEPTAQAFSSETPATTEAAQPTTEATQPTTEAAQPPTEAVTQGVTEAPTDAAQPTSPTEPVTEPTTAPEDNVPAFETAPPETEPSTVYEVVSEPFTGYIVFRFREESALFNSTYVRLDFFRENGKMFDVTLVVKPRLTDAGYKVFMFRPQDYGLALNRWESYSVRAYDTGGNSAQASFTITGANSVTIYP